MKNQIYIIPGLGESTRMLNYRPVVKLLKKEGFKVVPIKITWGMEMNMTDFIHQVEKQIPDDSSERYILGFSFGACIAAVLSKRKKFKGIIFCSLSPYFKEDLDKIPQESKDYFGKDMMSSFKKYSFPSKSASRAWFLIGTKDWPLAIRRAETAYDLWSGEKEIFKIEDAEHNLNHPNYLKKIVEIIKGL